MASVQQTRLNAVLAAGQRHRLATGVYSQQDFELDHPKMKPVDYVQLVLFIGGGTSTTFKLGALGREYTGRYVTLNESDAFAIRDLFNNGSVQAVQLINSSEQTIVHLTNLKVQGQKIDSINGLALEADNSQSMHIDYQRVPLPKVEISNVKSE